MTEITDQSLTGPYSYYRMKDALAGFGFGMLVNVCGIHLTLPHEHPLSPSFMNGVGNTLPGGLSIHLAWVQIISALAVSMAMSASRVVTTNSSDQITIFPKEARLYQRVALMMTPLISIANASIVWAVLMGRETPMWPAFFNKALGGGPTPLAPWSVFAVAVITSAIVASIISNFQVQPKPGEQ